MQTGKLWKECVRRFWVEDKAIEQCRPHQNVFEREFAIHKQMIDKLCIMTVCHPKAWFRAACHVADVRNNTARKTSNYKTPIEVREHHTPDISSPLQF